MPSLRRKEFGEESAFAEFIFESPNGARRPVRLRIGRPYLAAPQEWACPFELAGFEARDVDFRGGDALQALGLTMTYALKRLEHFIGTGGRILHPDGGEPYTAEFLRVLFGR